MELIEQWGSGIQGIFREAETLGLLEPFIEEIGMRVRFTVYLDALAVPSLQQSRKSSSDMLEEKRLGSGVELGVESEMAPSSYSIA